MIAGIGADIAEVSRIKKQIDKYKNRFLEKILSAEEIKLIPAKGSEHFIAGRFAAKEATVKALGRPFEFSRLIILNDYSGKPYVNNPDFIFENEKGMIIHISISHEKNYAIAVAIIENSYNAAEIRLK